MTLRVSYLEYMLLLIDIILALFRSPVFSLIDTRLFTVYTCSLQYRSTRSTSVLITFTSQHANPHRPQPPIIA